MFYEMKNEKLPYNFEELVFRSSFVAILIIQNLTPSLVFSKGVSKFSVFNFKGRKLEN